MKLNSEYKKKQEEQTSLLHDYPYSKVTYYVHDTQKDCIVNIMRISETNNTLKGTDEIIRELNKQANIIQGLKTTKRRMRNDIRRLTRENMKLKMNDSEKNNEPSYYNRGGVSPLTAFEEGLLTEEEYIGFVKGNIIKYIIRMHHKTSDVESDCDKAIYYIECLRKHYQNNTPIKNTTFVNSNNNNDGGYTTSTWKKQIQDEWEDLIISTIQNQDNPTL